MDNRFTYNIGVDCFDAPDATIPDTSAKTENLVKEKNKAITPRPFYYYEYITERGTEEYEDFSTFFPNCTTVYGVIQLADKLSESYLTLRTGTVFKFIGNKSAGLPMVFVAGILHDKAAEYDRAQFRVGTSSMSLLLVTLRNEGGFEEYVKKCIAFENTGDTY